MFESDSNTPWAPGRDVRKFLRNCVDSGQLATHAEQRRVGRWPAILATAVVGIVAGLLASVGGGW